MDSTEQPRYSYTIAEATNSAVWEWDLTTDIVQINERWAEIIGYTKLELGVVTIKLWESLVHPDDLHISNRELQAVFSKQKEYYHAELRMKHRNGNWINIFDSGKVVKWSEDGRPLVALGTHIDITEYKKSEAELKATTQLLKEIVDNTKDIIYRTNNTGKIIYLSDAITKNLGFGRETSIGTFLHDFVHPEDIKALTKYFDNVSLKQQSSDHLTFRLKNKDGAWRTFETIASPLFENDVFRGYVGVARDITMIESVNRELKEQKEELDRFFRVNLDLFCIVDENGRLQKVNRAWETVLGYPQQYLINKPLMNFIHPEDLVGTVDMISRIISQKFEAAHFINRYRRLDGTYVFIEWNAIPHGKFLYASGRDITRRIDAQKQLINEKEHFRTTLMSVGDGIIVTDEKGTITEINHMAMKLTGFSLEDAIGNHIDSVYKIYDEKNKKPIVKLVEMVVNKKQGLDLSNIYLATKTGKELLIDDSVSPIRGQGGTITGVVIAFRDVSEIKERQRKIEYLSYHDQLTDLYNRHYLDKTQREINKPANFPLAIISLDLNDLKIINDSYGHHAGDEALKRTADALKKHVHQRGYSFRIGGDEFLAFLPKTSYDEAESIVNAIVKDVERKKTNGHNLKVAVGLSVVEMKRSDLYHAIKIADDRMYADKLRKKHQG